MEVVSSLDAVATDGASVISIGNFDGVHLGHEAILGTVVKRAQELGARSVAMTFEPHPIRFLAPNRAPKLISTLDQKISLIAKIGIDLLFVAKFDEEFSRLSPERFIKLYIEEGFRTRAICVGSNFNFGYRQGGTVETLRRWNAALEVIEVPPVTVRGTVVSSTRIRELVSEGKLSYACRMLDRWFEAEGPIVSGAGRGRTVTVPTLNLSPLNELIPRIGVYATRISLDGAPYRDSITNVGVRPTFGEHDLTVETYVMEGAVPEHAGSARLQFLHRLRNEIKFESPEALRRQILVDVARCSRFFRSLNTFHNARHRQD